MGSSGLRVNGIKAIKVNVYELLGYVIKGSIKFKVYYIQESVDLTAET